MKHTHADLIIQLANDTSLVKLVKRITGWEESQFKDIYQFFFDEELAYILVPAKHVDIALAHLNGTDTVQIKVEGAWVNLVSRTTFPAHTEFRIKPKQEYISQNPKSSLSGYIAKMEMGTKFYLIHDGEPILLQSYQQLLTAYLYESFYTCSE